MGPPELDTDQPTESLLPRLVVSLLWLTTALAIALLASLLVSPARAADCNHFFYRQQVAAVVAPYYAAPIYYQAGRDIEADAFAEKIIRRVEQKLQTREPVQQQVKATGAFASCVRCHTGATPAGGVVLDGETPVPCSVYLRWGEMAGLGENVPNGMKNLLNAMTPEQKGEVNSALIRLAKQYLEGGNSTRDSPAGD